MAIGNPSFEDEVTGENPGKAQGWIHAAVGGTPLVSWAGYQAHDSDPNYWAVERFEGGWNNDDGFKTVFEVTDLAELPTGAETFEDWIGVPMEFDKEFEASDLEAAEFDVWDEGATTWEWEGFESLWDNDFPFAPGNVYLWHFQPWEDGVEPSYIDPTTGNPAYIIGTADKIVIWLGKWTGSAMEVFEAEISIDAGTYSVADMITELEAKTDAALTAAGAPWVTTDLTWSQAPGGGMRIEFSKSTYFMISAEPADSSAWSALGFTINSATHHHPIPADVLGSALYSPGLSYEMFDLYWNNFWDEVLWDQQDFIDAHDVTYPVTITLNVNDKVTIWYDDLGGTTIVGNLTLTPGVYPTAAAMAAELETQINAWLTSEGPPHGPTDIDATTNPSGQIRVINKNLSATNLQMWLTNPTSANGWATLGFDVADFLAPGVPDLKTRRMPVFVAMTYADYDAGTPESVEDFEEEWP